MKKTLVAGATGYLGGYIVRELLKREQEFVALGRSRTKLKALGLSDSQMTIGEVTQPETLTNAFEDVDTVISTVGITRQKDGLTYMDVDYQANMNLLELAKAKGVKKFIYISAINGDKMRHLKIMEAKERFVDALKSSEMKYTILRPNGFFSDMTDFLEMAKGGRIYLFGDGEFKFNPIHGEDLAQVVIDSVDSPDLEIEVGGPDVLTQNEIGEMALSALNKPMKIVHLPNWLRKAFVQLMHTFTSSKTYGPIEFFLDMMARDNIAPRYGIHRLTKFYSDQVDLISTKS